MPGVVRAITRIQDADDFSGSLTDTYIPVWSNSQQKFVMTAQSGGGGGAPGGSTTQVQYNSSGSFAGHSGFTYDGAGKVTLSAALVVPVVRPASDSTAAWKVTKADGTTAVVTVDTTNGRLGLGLQPSDGRLHIDGSSGVAISINTSGTAKARMASLVADWFGFAVNTKYNGSSWDMDSTSLNGAFFKVDVRNSVYGDAIGFYTVPKTGSTPIPDSTLRSTFGSRLSDRYAYCGWIDVVNSPKYLGQFTVVSKSAIDKTFVAQAALVQSANIIEAQDSNSTVQWAVGATGKIMTNQAVTNTNTPSGTTAKAMPIYNVAGTLLGYIPVYASQW